MNIISNYSTTPNEWTFPLIPAQYIHPELCPAEQKEGYYLRKVFRKDIVYSQTENVPNINCCLRFRNKMF